MYVLFLPFLLYIICLPTLIPRFVYMFIGFILHIFFKNTFKLFLFLFLKTYLYLPNLLTFVELLFINA